MSSPHSNTEGQFEAQFEKEGVATLAIRRSHLGRFRRMVRQLETKGEVNRIGMLAMIPPVSSALMGKLDARDETAMICISNFDRISRVEIDDSGSGDPKVTLYRKDA
ncbi:MAG TPA: hypothetical protein PLA50_04400 [Bacteroidia bacterium]|nr:hypothetical protein [Bacteroidia bacterium]